MMHSFLGLTSQSSEDRRTHTKEGESTTARIINPPAIASRWLTCATDATVCSGDDSNHPGLIGNVKCLVSAREIPLLGRCVVVLFCAPS